MNKLVIAAGPLWFDEMGLGVYMDNGEDENGRDFHRTTFVFVLFEVCIYIYKGNE